MLKRKVARLAGPRKFEIAEEKIKPPGAKELLIRIVSAGLCHTEVAAYLGKSAIAVSKDGKYFKNDKLKYPLELGHEGVGIVEEVGKDVKEFKQGEWVGGVIKSSFASYVTVDVTKRSLAKIPDGISDRKYCLVEPLMCVTNIVRAAAPRFGDYVAVIGCGAMGLLCLSALAKSAAFEIVALDLVDFRLRMAEKLGATKTINPGKVKTEKVVEQLTDGRGMDVVIEISGRMSGFSLACDIIRGGWSPESAGGRGKILIPSLYAFPEVMDAGYQLMFKSPIIHSTHPWYSMNYREDMTRGIEGYSKGIFPLKQLVTHEFSLENIEDGFEMMVEPEENYIKGIVVP
ncbi:alcohol dehydrogenase catalytic domain-containing protein [Candidatus Aerophobetes bacterium]|nr:alcohol dehydrogenase catalytic domain-containing protein [Candidatus Aerophobetes bacterium]